MAQEAVIEVGCGLNAESQMSPNALNREASLVVFSPLIF